VILYTAYVLGALCWAWLLVMLDADTRPNAQASVWMIAMFSLIWPICVVLWIGGYIHESMKDDA